MSIVCEPYRNAKAAQYGSFRLGIKAHVPSEQCCRLASARECQGLFWLAFLGCFLITSVLSIEILNAFGCRIEDRLLWSGIFLCLRGKTQARKGPVSYRTSDTLQDEKTGVKLKERNARAS